MKIPKGMTETQVTDLILKIAKLHAHKHAFSIFDHDDIIQESYLICIESLDRYDGTRPLENFLRINLLNRLKNFYRKHKKKDMPQEDLGGKPLEDVLYIEYTDIPELDDIIDGRLDTHLREDYLKYKNNIKIPRAREQNLVEKLREILDQYWRLHLE